MGTYIPTVVVFDGTFNDPVSRSAFLESTQVDSLKLDLSKFRLAHIHLLAQASFREQLTHLEICSNQPARFGRECIDALSQFPRLRQVTLVWFFAIEGPPPEIDGRQIEIITYEPACVSRSLYVMKAS